MDWKKKYLNSKNLIFASVWALISYFIGSGLAKIIEFINNFMDYLVNILLYGITGPNAIVELLKIQMPWYIKLSLVFGVALILSPIGIIFFNFIMKLLRKSPI